MRGIFLMLFLALSSTGLAKTFYVAPSTTIPAGSDRNPGTKDRPWATWHKAFNSTLVLPGDTVYFRGGVYYKHLIDGSPYKITRGGTITDTLCFFAYPGEVPILDCKNTVPTGSLNVGIQGGAVKYCKFNGLKIRNVWSVNAGVECIGFRFYGSVGVVVENCTVYNVHGVGFHSDRGYDTHYINCDAYNCCDVLALYPQLPGNRGSGFSSTNTLTRDGSVYYKYCRAWNCSDQGFVAGSASYVEWNGCWSFKNGSLQGGGHGFKIGFVYLEPIYLSRVLKNCISCYNRVSGITTNDMNTACQIMHIYNNTSYHNGYFPKWSGSVYGFYVYNTKHSNETELNRIFRNNISFDNEGGSIHIEIGASYSHDHNSWDVPVALTSTDFVSLDSTGISGPRQIDGSLPYLRGFLMLNPTSKAVDAGIDVGLPFYNKPDLGAYEYVPGPFVNKNPSVTIISPSNGSTFVAPATISIAASASDADGSVVKVEFFKGTAKIGEKTSAPWSFTWSNVPSGSYSITAVATDNSGAKKTSSAISLTVNAPVNQPPTISITSPLGGSIFVAPATISIAASASDADGSVVKVEFFKGAEKIGEKTSAPWSSTWSNVPSGTYSITAVATDNSGAKKTSSAVVVNVNTPKPANQPPIITISNPMKGEAYSEFGNVDIEAVAYDPDGTIIKVEFYNGDSKLSELTSAPWVYTWKDVEAGTYSIVAIATDNLNAKTASSPVEVKVENTPANDATPEIVKLYPNPNNGIFTIERTNPVQGEQNKITIISCDGKVIYHELILQEEPLIQFDFSHIKPGHYIMILSGNYIFSSKVFIKN
jgi:hypothetical protein